MLGGDGVEPGLVAAQQPVALDLLRDVAEDGHQPIGVELDDRERQHLRVAAPGNALGQLQLPRFAHGAARCVVALDEQSQIRGDRLQCGVEVVERAFALQRHQELRRKRIDHVDPAVERPLHQPDRDGVEKLRQRLEFLVRVAHRPPPER